MLEIFKAIIYGIVEGITEWLPISSTGHLILVQEFMPFRGVEEDFWKMFEVVIQLGAIMAVVCMYFKQIWPFDFSKKKQINKKDLLSYVKMDIMTLWFKIVVACLPAILFVVVGLEEKCEKLFFKPMPIACALIVVGVAFIAVELWNKDRRSRIHSTQEITYQTALMIGLFQLIAAAFPGTSRSGATIIGALLLGVSRGAAAEFTFFLAIPVMFGASVLKLLDFGLVLSPLELGILITGMLVAFVVSLFVLKFLMNYIKKHDFKVFGYYRIAIGILVLCLSGYLA